MILDIINKKRLNQELSYKELDYFFNEYLNGNIKDYQMSSLLMAICINGLSEKETIDLTKIFIESGDILDFSDITNKIIVDKHSTGGIGDKTTLIISPIVSSCGVPIIKMSGRGLGYTGGTIDKLESIKGYKTSLTKEEIMKQFKEIGIVLCSQTDNLVPMDKAIYALRDVSGTTSSIGLIASSIMSKKIAAGANKILLDIKYGSGALIETKKEALILGELMIKIGESYNREVRYILSDMNVPLGYNIGNALEVQEAIDVLTKKETSGNLVDLCYTLSSTMISMSKGISIEKALEEVKKSIDSNKAYDKFLELVKYQGGEIDSLNLSNITQKYKAKKTGIITKIDAKKIGILSLNLGAGRKNKEDKIDYSVGIKLEKHIGDYIKKGDVLCKLYVKSKINLLDLDGIFTIE